MFFNQENNVLPPPIRGFFESQGMIDTRPYPNIDIIETNRELIVYIEIPGINESSIHIDFFNNRLDIKGVKVCPYDNDARIFSNNIKYGSLDRSITLPLSVTKRESVKVDCDKGVLTIRVDKEIESVNRFNIRLNSSENEEND